MGENRVLRSGTLARCGSAGVGGGKVAAARPPGGQRGRAVSSSCCLPSPFEDNDHQWRGFGEGNGTKRPRAVVIGGPAVDASEVAALVSGAVDNSSRMRRPPTQRPGQWFGFESERANESFGGGGANGGKIGARM